MLMPLDLFARAAKLRRYVTFDSKLCDHVKKQQRRQKRNYDKRHAVRDTQLRAGENVYVRRDVVPQKLIHRWKAPQEIAATEKGSSVRLKDGSLRSYADVVPVPDLAP